MKLPGKNAAFSRLGLASVRFEARGGRHEKLLSWCMSSGVQLYEVMADDTGFTARAAAGDYARLRAPARRCRTRLRIQRRCGGWFGIRWLLRRPGLLLGPALFGILMLAGSHFLWAARFAEIPVAEQQKIRLVLRQNGLYEGASVTEQKLQSAQQALLVQSENWGWITLNFYKGRLVIERTEAKPTQPVVQTDLRPYVAAVDASVLENRVESGFAQKQIGEAAAVGEVLIAAERPARDGTPVVQEPLGQVIGLIEREYTDYRPLQEEYIGLTGKTAVLHSLTGPLGTITPKNQAPDFEDYEVKAYSDPVTAAGMAFPATVTDQLFLEKAPLRRTLSPQAARRFARYSCLAQLYAEFPDAEILSQSVQESWQNGTLCYKMHLVFRANIAHKADSA